MQEGREEELPAHAGGLLARVRGGLAGGRGHERGIRPGAQTPGIFGHHGECLVAQSDEADVTGPLGEGRIHGGAGFLPAAIAQKSCG